MIRAGDLPETVILALVILGQYEEEFDPEERLLSTAGRRVVEEFDEVRDSLRG